MLNNTRRIKITPLKNQTISQNILSNIQSRMSLNQAFDAILGDGAYMKLAGEVYDSLRNACNMTGFKNYMDAEPASNYPVQADERSVTFDATILGYLDVLVTVDFDSDGDGVVSEVMAEGKDGYDITDSPELQCRFDEWIEQAKEMEA